MRRADSLHSSDLDVYRNAMSVREVLERLGIDVNGTGFIACLLHTEKTPSMKLYADHLYCHSCGGRLDLIGLVQHVRGFDFWSAINWIADTSNLPRPQRDPEAQKRYEEIRSVSNIYSQVFRDSLTDPEPAIAYLEKRRISRETTKENVGYLPSNYKPPDMETARRAGLYSQKGNFLFADRLIIPIIDRGRTVSLYGRALDSKHLPAHIYPGATHPPMPSTIWNLDACRREKALYLAESIIDAMTLVDRGIRNCAGLFGTQGLTDARLEALRKTSIEKIILCFDADANGAGQAAVLKTGEKLFRDGYDVRIRELPLEPGEEKTDVNSYFQNHSLDDFKGFMARDFFDCELDSIPSKGSPREKYKALKPVLELIAEQPELLWKEYANALSVRFPELDKRKIEKQVSQNSKDSEDVKETGKKFRPLAYVDEIRKAAPVICFDGRYYRYENGVYSPWYSEEVDQATIELIGPETQGSHLDAIRKFLASVCFVRPEKVNPRGLLNLKNGILDVESGSFNVHSPDILSTVQSQTSFELAATCPLWLQTIKEILPDPESQRLLSQIFGYSLTPDNSHQKGFIFYGDGANGKSVITDVLEALAGSDNCSALHLSDFKERFRLAELQNRLINFSTEVEAKGLVDDARIKGIITGDPLTAERKNQQPFVFRPFVKLLVSCNNLPQTTDKSYGYFRRWIILPFTETFSAQNKDRRRAKTIIKTELSGVLNWAIGGYKSLKDLGSFIEPKASADAQEEYRRQSDPTIDFVSENVRILSSESNGTALQEIYDAYKKWTTQNGNKPLGRNKFYEGLERTTKRKALDSKTGGKFIAGVFLR